MYRLTSRVLLLGCYFLPCMFFFQKCTGTKYYAAYNKNEYLAVKDKVASTQWGRNIDSMRALEVKSVKERVFNTITKPIPCSASGIGAIIYAKDKWANFFILISIFISKILLINVFIKSKMLDLSLLTANIISVIAFICISYYTQVTLLYGIYVLLFWLLILLGIEVYSYRRLLQPNNIHK